MDMMPPSQPFTVAELSAVAVAADVSTRTVRRYLANISVLPSTFRRVEAALRTLGLFDRALALRANGTKRAA